MPTAASGSSFDLKDGAIIENISLSEPRVAHDKDCGAAHLGADDHERTESTNGVAGSRNEPQNPKFPCERPVV